jgi:predicted transcriptional regulator
MTALTVHLDDALLKRTQEMAEARHATVDDVVANALENDSRQWRSQNASDESYETRRQRLEQFFEKYAGIDTGGPYTRDEMNER